MTEHSVEQAETTSVDAVVASDWLWNDRWNSGWQRNFSGFSAGQLWSGIDWRADWRKPRVAERNLGQTLRGEASSNRCMVYGDIADTSGKTASSSSGAPSWSSVHWYSSERTHGALSSNWSHSDREAEQCSGGFGFDISSTAMPHSSTHKLEQWSQQRSSNSGWISNSVSGVEGRPRDWPPGHLHSYTSWSPMEATSLQRMGDRSGSTSSYWTSGRHWNSAWEKQASADEWRLSDYPRFLGQQASKWQSSWQSTYPWAEALTNNDSYSRDYTSGESPSGKTHDCMTEANSNVTVGTSLDASRNKANADQYAEPGEKADLAFSLSLQERCEPPTSVGQLFTDCGFQPKDRTFKDEREHELKWGLTPLMNRTSGSRVRASSVAAPIRPQRSAEESLPSMDLWANFSATRSASVGRPLARSSLRKDFQEHAFRPLQDPAAAARLAVMLEDVVELLMQGSDADATYADCTFGRGGHSSEILRRLSPKGRLIGFDIDPAAIKVARALERSDPRFKCHHKPHGDLSKVIDSHVESLGGVLIDLGSHTTQAEDRSRGFSVVDDGPLDLRLNPEYGVPASEWLQTVSVQELGWVIHEHGEDSDMIMSMRLAEGILERQRCLGRYTSTLQLADVCRDVKQGVDDRGQHPAKLTFQAIRAFLNHEVEQLDLALRGAMERLQPGGRCVVITYKRKEAAQVKRFLREHEEADPRFAGFVTMQRLVELYPLLATDLPWSCRQSCEPLRASPQECERNPRARPALVHVLTKQARDYTLSPCRGLKPRPECEQFKKPAPLPFEGATLSDETDFGAIGCSAVAETGCMQIDEISRKDDVLVDDPDYAEHGDIVAEPGPNRDWICPQCGDLQWARRPRCRLCGCAPSKYG